ncbi:MAG: hypothetical protein LWX56_02385 [Ignavibacteria bacterium]|nr:hypothetical protein [Ignavibacteria bacterium]
MSAEKSFLSLSLYLSFFANIVSGPIERAQNLLPQFKTDHQYNYDNVVQGAKLFYVGLFRKVVIADNLAKYVNQVYDNNGAYHGMPLILASYLFAIQIYCDFAGYSEMALGLAKALGYNLTLNFNSPYKAKSIPEFWKKWHISLTSWFRDYLFVALEYIYAFLGGETITKTRWYVNMLVVFVVSGLWHGAGWSFIVWGLLHGVFLISSPLLKNFREQLAALTRINKAPRIRSAIALFTTFHLVTFAWIFFRSGTISAAFTNIVNIFDFNYNSNSISVNYLALAIAVSTFLFIELKGSIKTSIIKHSSNTSVFLTPVLRIAFYVIITVLILFFGQFEATNFIYFQF